MSHTTSLCITYIYHDIKGPRLSVYRIADYEEGEFFPLDPQTFTDDISNFNPRYLRTRSGEEGPLYVPTLKEWRGVVKYEDVDRMTTESYPYSYCNVLELVILPELIDQDPIVLQKKIRTGFSLPIGLCDTFLLALDQNDTTYTVAKCRKSMLKQNGEHFCFDDNINDMLHATHFLETFIIEKQDIFDTSSFSSFYMEDRSPAPIRTFYKYDYLPERDGLFYLHEISEYLIFFVSRFLKKESKKYELSKSQLQKVATAIEEAAASEKAIKDFFTVTGYTVDEVKEILPTFQKSIMQTLLGYDEIDSIIASFLETDAAARERMIFVAKQNWLASADDDRKKAEDELSFLRGELATANQELEKLISLCKTEDDRKLAILEEIDRLEQQKSDIEQATLDAVKHLDDSIGNHLATYSVLKHFGIGANNSCATTDSGFTYSYPHNQDDPSCKQTNELSKATAVLQSNLKKAGMNTYYANIVAAQTHNAQTRVNAYIISGFFARNFAHAMSNSLDGTDATSVAVTDAQPHYSVLCNIINAAPGRVVLIEHLLDYCNEVVLAALCRDYKNKTIIFSIDDESGLSALSKSIWNYAWYVNADVAFCDLIETPQYTKVVVDETIGRIKLNYTLDGYQSLNDILLGLDLPLIARANIIGLVRFFKDEHKAVSPKEFIESLVAKLCFIYRSTIADDELISIVDTLPDKFTSLYFKQ